jgi:hypothetical protein
MSDDDDIARAVRIAVTRSLEGTTVPTIQVLGALRAQANPAEAAALQRCIDEIGGQAHERRRGHPETDDSAAVARIRSDIAAGKERDVAIHNEARRTVAIHGGNVDSVKHRLREKLKKAEAIHF